MVAYVAGDNAAFDALFDRHADILFRIVQKRVSNAEDARDLVQQTLLRVHRARNDFRSGSPLRPWLFTIAMNTTREHFRHRGRRRENPLEGEPVLLDSRGPDEAPIMRERVARVRAALARLPQQQRQVIELHWFDGDAYEEIALIVGASVAAVRVRAHRGYERLRQMLSNA